MRAVGDDDRHRGGVDDGLFEERFEQIVDHLPEIAVNVGVFVIDHHIVAVKIGQFQTVVVLDGLPQFTDVPHHHDAVRQVDGRVDGTGAAGDDGRHRLVGGDDVLIKGDVLVQGGFRDFFYRFGENGGLVPFFDSDGVEEAFRFIDDLGLVGNSPGPDFYALALLLGDLLD